LRVKKGTHEKDPRKEDLFIQETTGEVFEKGPYKKRTRLTKVVAALY